MRKLLLATALTVLTLPAFAEGLTVGQTLGTSETAVHDSLVALGYDVRRLEMEGGMIEAYAVKGKEMAEISVSPTSGLIVDLGGNG